MTTTTDLRHVTRTLWTMLGFCTFASVTANVAHAVMWSADGDWKGPVLIALLAPMILLGLMHLVGVWARDIQARGAVFWAILVTVASLAAVAFRLSFVAVRDLAEHYGLDRFDAALVPLMLDGVIVTCTVSLVAVSRRAAPVQEPVATAPDLPTATAPEPAPAAATTTRAATLLEPVVDSDAATEELPVVAATAPVADPVATAPAAPVTSEDTVAADANHQATTTEPTESEEPLVAPAAADHHRPTTPVAAPELRLVDDAARGGSHAAVTAELVAAGRLKPENQAAATRALELLAADPPPSQRAVAVATGIDRSVVRKLIDAMEGASA